MLVNKKAFGNNRFGSSFSEKHPLTQANITCYICGTTTMTEKTGNVKEDKPSENTM